MSEWSKTLTLSAHILGVESFIKTIVRMKPRVRPKEMSGPYRTMVQLLGESLRLRGFPLALQLLAYQRSQNFSQPFPSRLILVQSWTSTPNLPSSSPVSDIISVEADPDLQVTPLIPIHSQPQPGWGVWPDVSNDDRVSYMEQLIADHRPFTKDLWHGGDTSAPLITTATNDEDQPKSKKIKPEAPPKNAKPVTKKVLKPRKTAKKKDTVRKQRRISSYFHAASSSSISNDKILELLTAISDQTTTLFKRSAFITLLGEGLVKKGKTAFAHKGCQTEPTNDNVPVSSHDVCQTEPQADISHHTPQAPMEEDHIRPSLPPIRCIPHGSISHRSQQPPPHPHSPSTPQPSTLPHPHLPIHTSLIHTSPIHTSPIHIFPIHISPSTPPHPHLPIHTSPTQFSTHPFLKLPLSPLHLTPETFPNKGSDSLPGFVGHASTINAFSATPHPNLPLLPRPNIPLLNKCVVSAQPTEDSDVVSLSDSDGSPAPKRPKHIPSIEENHLAKQLERCKTVPAPDLISPLPQIEWDLFEKIISKSSAAFHITPSKLDFSNNFLLQLAQPMKWTTTYLNFHHFSFQISEFYLLFEEQKLVFITPHLTSGIQAISKAFNKSRKRDTFEWDEQLTGLVLQSGKKWMEDVLTFYTPMIWGDKHWVGLAINLDLGCVEVLDPLPTLYKDSAVGRFMAPVLKVLPYLVKKVANYELTQFRGLAPFTCHRIKDLYINERGGDCGPVSVKFLEMHAQGDPDHMSSITDSDVDDFRKQYVLDIYKTIVMPAYYG
ncbi:hypothetical protein Bca52824_088263 [Brassica carinata]|uniref:Ubiquitin-like protease family profile domain-containing protein n=1 Tax=Brassica carinata TaxID=52824 RepID=A0A8X7PC76_BRACI|nr:hypothetical protein Bca52824_088263 [Brassica carinata]